MKRLLILLCFIIVTVGLYSEERFAMKHKVWLRTAYRQSGVNQYSTGLHYLPEFKYTAWKTEAGNLDLNMEGYLWITAELNHEYSTDIEPGKTEGDGNAEFYRAWTRWSAEKYEVRFGLQKLNFGTAYLLRSEQWFDSVDPRDDMGFTTGVWGALCRYYTGNNGTIWLWTILGKDELKGSELFKSKDDSPEFGGRIQMPILGYEQAITYHYRNLDTSFYRSENRFGLDGRWDFFIGLWYEATLSAFDEDEFYAKSLTTGLDYTLGLGNGLHVLTEHLYKSYSEEDITSSDDEINFTAASVDYPIDLNNNIQSFFVYDWETEKVSSYISWSRTTDYFTVTTSYSLIPEEFTKNAKHIFHNSQIVQFSIECTF